MLKMNYEASKFWFDMLQTLLITGVGIMSWLFNRQRITTAMIARLEENIDGRLDSQLERLTRVEQDLIHVPDHNDFKRVHQRLDVLNGEFKEIKGELNGVKTTLNLIHQHLLTKQY
jgi:hypothetical protein